MNVVPMGEGRTMDPMEMMINKAEQMYQETRDALDSNISEEVISERVGGGGKKLSYLEGWYVIARMNEIFGQGRWGYVTDDPKLVYSSNDDGYFNVAYTARVHVTAMGRTFTDVGYGDGKDRHGGKAHESAIKEAVTDGMKRAAKNFGMSMGLALYDKTKEFVGEEQPKAGAGNTKRAANNKSKGVQNADAGATRTESFVASTVEPVGTPDKTETSTTTQTRDEVNTLLSSTTRVVLAKRKFADVAAVKAYMTTTYGTDVKEKLTDEQAKDFLDYLTALSRS